MDELSQKEFNRITSISPEGLTGEEKDFLRARRSYLRTAQKEEYAEVIKETKEVKK